MTSRRFSLDIGDATKIVAPGAEVEYIARPQRMFQLRGLRGTQYVAGVSSEAQWPVVACYVGDACVEGAQGLYYETASPRTCQCGIDVRLRLQNPLDVAAAWRGALVGVTSADYQRPAFARPRGHGGQPSKPRPLTREELTCVVGGHVWLPGSSHVARMCRLCGAHEEPNAVGTYGSTQELARPEERCACGRLVETHCNACGAPRCVEHINDAHGHVCWMSDGSGREPGCEQRAAVARRDPQAVGSCAGCGGPCAPSCKRGDGSYWCPACVVTKLRRNCAHVWDRETDPCMISGYAWRCRMCGMREVRDPMTVRRACADCGALITDACYPVDHNVTHCEACYTRHVTDPRGRPLTAEELEAVVHKAAELEAQRTAEIEASVRKAPSFPQTPAEVPAKRGVEWTTGRDNVRFVTTPRCVFYCEHAPPREVVEGTVVTLDGDECGGVPPVPRLTTHLKYTARQLVAWERHEAHEARWTDAAKAAAARGDQDACQYAFRQYAARQDHDMPFPIGPDMYGGLVETTAPDDEPQRGYGYRCRLCGGWLRRVEVRR